MKGVAGRILSSFQPDFGFELTLIEPFYARGNHIQMTSVDSHEFEEESLLERS